MSRLGDQVGNTRDIPPLPDTKPKLTGILETDGLLAVIGIQIRCEKDLDHHISGGLVSISIFIKHFLSVLKISKTFVFFLGTSGEYSKKYRLDKDPFSQWILENISLSIGI